jgi:phosphoglycolate phosphatase
VPGLGRRFVIIRGILFDKDGTLLDYWKTWVPINREAALFAAGGDAVLADELLRHGGHDPSTNHVASGSVLAVGSHDEIAAAFAARLGSRTPPKLAMNIERIFREGGAKHSVLIDGVREVIVDLRRRGYRLGVATNDSAGGLQASLGVHRLLDKFDFLAGCDSGFGVKPEPGMALAFCQATGLHPSAIAVVGDAVHDLEMGRRAGVGSKVGVLSGTAAREDLEPHADVLIGSVANIAACLTAS